MDHDELAASVIDQNGIICDNVRLEISELRNQLNQEMIERERLESECRSLRAFLRSSILFDRSSLIHKMKQTGVIKSRIVYESILITDSTDFDDDDGDMEYSLKQQAMLLESICPFVSRGSKILVLISGFSAASLISLCWLIADVVSLAKSSDDVTSLSPSLPSSNGSVIAKASKADARLLMSGYKFLMESNVLRINVFSESSVLKNGYSKGGLFDVILVPEIGWSEGLKSQIKTNGLFVSPFDLSTKLTKTSDGRLQTTS